MGIRLSIENEKNESIYGTGGKVYGYCQDHEKFAGLKYLYENAKMLGESCGKKYADEIKSYEDLCEQFDLVPEYTPTFEITKDKINGFVQAYIGDIERYGYRNLTEEEVIRITSMAVSESEKFYISFD